VQFLQVGNVVTDDIIITDSDAGMAGVFTVSCQNPQGTNDDVRHCFSRV